MGERAKSLSDLNPNAFYRLPDRSYEAGHITHLLPKDMNRKERRQMERDVRRNPHLYVDPRLSPKEPQ